MIHELTLQGFKRFGRQSFEIAPLMVLAGLNGTGKTSLIQALVLAREASLGRMERSVRLNGLAGLELGTAEDVHNWGAQGDIVFDMRYGAGQSARWRFAVPGTATEALYARRAGAP
jgi:recombinational DNA repair ATPase RecF